MTNNLGMLAIVELVSFNIIFVLIYQPAFIFDILKLSPEKSKLLSNIMTAVGLLLICFIFCWSFYFGASIVIQKNELIRSY